ncbi:LacI family transcriptional regulator [Enterococcus sp. JM4C]|uniref:LacI family DNA-binding transcriptional regulator n=1 Tax=Candidatus Enterococcus huntleyi TaxID=1857217 RepID=UPI001379C230|nr:LacI family DNA-binding transcriptional regulator [Enterococcus sp. JM4C]KAF1299272.1 LacI family transcriptional regulator [Enterococcus sp. JM4C]
MVTLKEIAKNSGYSQATVSRLFKGDSSLSITNETKQKIIHTALSMGYDRSKIKTTLEKIAVLFWLTEQEELQDVYFQQLRLSLEKYAQLSNMEIEMIKHEQDTIQIPDSVSGFVGVGSFTSKELLTLKEKCPNGVLLELNPEPDLFDTVKPDTDRITRQAIDYFLKKGYKKIGFIGGAFHNPDEDEDESDSREIAFRQYAKKKGVLNEEYIFSKGKFTVNQGYELTLELINQLGDDLPDAFFIASDTIAVGALQAFNERYISIPDRLEIISVNDTEISKFVSPPLTTFRIDVEEIAKTAIDMLVDQIVYPRQITKTVLLGSEIIIRKSFQP